MPSVEVFDGVQALLTANWTATPVVYENDTQPPKAAETPLGLKPWVLVEIEGSSYFQMTEGAGTKAANLWREEGLIYLHVHVPANTGSRQARQHADALAELFRTTEGIGTQIQYHDMSIGAGMVGQDNGKWWAMTVTVQWRRI